jgi:phosphoribosyl 1,2-cyclic phosphodiesterase
MGLRFASLGSGSEGNALLVQCDETAVMLDCGFGVRELIKRSERIGFDLSTLDAIIVTHEHSDHVGGAPRLARHLGIPVWMTFGTLTATQSMWDDVTVRGFDSHDAFAIGDIECRPFPVPHDAREPAQFVFTDGDVRLGVLTDVGESTPHIEASLSDCEALFLEANHCENMLDLSPYPPSLKRRIAGRFGHLSNRDSAALLSRVASAKLKHVVGAHLSRQNNTDELVMHAFSEIVRTFDTTVSVATQSEGIAWIDIKQHVSSSPDLIGR